MKKTTPLMKQYQEIRDQYPGVLLFFRMGDFFELFFEDAIVAAPVMGVTLTYRNKKSGDETPMCGVPHHSVAKPINKLLEHGFRIALCDQLENPSEAKRIVKRGVTRVLSPGMVLDPETLEPSKQSFIATITDAGAGASSCAKTASSIDSGNHQHVNRHAHAAEVEQKVAIEGSRPDKNLHLKSSPSIGSSAQGSSSIGPSAQGSSSIGPSAQDRYEIAFIESTTGESFWCSASSQSEAIKTVKLFQPVEFLINDSLSPGFLQQMKDAFTNELCMSHPVQAVQAGDHSQGAEARVDVQGLKSLQVSETSQDAKTLSYLQLLRVSENLQDLAENDRGEVSHPNTAFNFEKSPAAWRLLAKYLINSQGGLIAKTLRPPEYRPLSHFAYVSEEVRRHLEIFQTQRAKTDGSLFWAINTTKTSMGARLLRSWLTFPLKDQQEIKKRQQKVAWHKSRFEELKQTREVLAQIGDLPRKFGKISTNSVAPNDIASIAHSLELSIGLLERNNELSSKVFGWDTEDQSKAATGDQLATLFKSKSNTPPRSRSSALLENQSATSHMNESMAVRSRTEEFAGKELSLLKEWISQIQREFKEELPANLSDGGIFKRGVDPKLDEWIELSEDSRTAIAKMEEAERSLTGISSLKIRYNQVFGYYIEITNSHKDKVPNERYLRKQTLVNAERFTTDELNELERRVLSSRTRRVELESSLFYNLRAELLALQNIVNHIADKIAHLDVVSSFAWNSLERSFCTPQVDPLRNIRILSLRHPVLERMISTRFVANDFSLKSEHSVLLTGPNMAGKSTQMKAVALCALLHQVGSDVPASEAKLPVFDSIFTRIGASDSLTDGLSTFMVEMVETANVLKESTASSLVLLDEIGRGTSTYDGLSLASAIFEELTQNVKCQVLFATHYHELTEMMSHFENVHDFHMSVSESSHGIEFTYRLKSGAAGKSYGIEVAKLAGVKNSVVSRAFQILSQLGGSTEGELGSLSVSAADVEKTFEGGLDRHGEYLGSRKLNSEEAYEAQKASGLSKFAEIRSKQVNEKDDARKFRGQGLPVTAMLGASDMSIMREIVETILQLSQIDVNNLSPLAVATEVADLQAKIQLNEIVNGGRCSERMHELMESLQRKGSTSTEGGSHSEASRKSASSEPYQAKLPFFE